MTDREDDGSFRRLTVPARLFGKMGSEQPSGETGAFPVYSSARLREGIDTGPERRDIRQWPDRHMVETVPPDSCDPRHTRRATRAAGIAGA